MVKLKVLCLHGYRQNETTFKERTGALRKLLKRDVDFIFISAPHVIPEPQNLTRPHEEQERGWFFSRPEKAYRGIDETDLCIGLEESLQVVKKALTDLGPFDGILGFSQGACLISILCFQKEYEKDLMIEFQFVILFSGFKSLLTPHSYMYTNPFHCPSFHTIGETDGIIPARMSSDLAKSFSDAITYHHHGGHYVPASPQLHSALQDFIKPFLT